MKKTVKEMFETAYKYAQVHGRIGIYDEDDIVQDAMLKMITRDPMPANSSWLYKTVRSVAYDELRILQRRHRIIGLRSGPDNLNDSGETLQDTLENIAAKESDVDN